MGIASDLDTYNSIDASSTWNYIINQRRQCTNGGPDRAPLLG
ncbi:MAG: hypothetical protein Q8918_09875 [Bacteroidota bacterium]|nr:hypothetical protein [Bacteroidota bacterium]MDP4250401.1 hypothetical protein [Bacteroidota bacterium]